MVYDVFFYEFDCHHYLKVSSLGRAISIFQNGLPCWGSSSHGCSGPGHSGWKWILECHEYSADEFDGQWCDGFYEFDDSIRSSQFDEFVGFTYRTVPRGSRRGSWERQLKLGAKWLLTSSSQDTRAGDKLRREVRRDCWQSGPFRGAISKDFSFSKQICFLVLTPCPSCLLHICIIPSMNHLWAMPKVEPQPESSLSFFENVNQCHKKTCC